MPLPDFPTANGCTAPTSVESHISDHEQPRKTWKLIAGARLTIERVRGMGCCVLVFTLLATSAVEAAEFRSSFQVGLTISARATSVPIPTSAGRASVPLLRPRP